MQQHYCPYCMHPTEPGQICDGCGRSSASYRSEPHHFPAGKLLANRYYVGRVLGEGGFGITYLGLDVKLGRRVAIKEYFPRTLVRRESATTLNITCYTGSDQYFAKGREQFLVEAQTLAKLDSIPDIVHVLDFFPENNSAYIVMEYLEGTTLAKGGIRPAQELIALLEPVIKALEAIHQDGLIHRDISPDNLMEITKTGRVKLMDFGCAREMGGGHTMTVMLKRGFAPVEQSTGHQQGPWTDVYALCATMYYCITGKLPPDAMTRIHRDELVPPSQLCSDLLPYQERALLKGMAVNVEDRWQSAAEFYAALYGKTITGQVIRPQQVVQPTEFVPSSYRPGEPMPRSNHGAAVASTMFVDSVPNSSRRTVPEPPKQEKKKKKSALPAVLLALALVGGAAAFWFLHPHQYKDWVITKESTCLETGMRERKCFCGDTQYEGLPLSGHTEVIDVEVPASCIATGLSEGSHCAVCEIVLREQLELPLTDHNLVTSDVIPATCTESGLTSGTACSVCDYVVTEQEVLEALGHDPQDYEELAATCIAEGYTGGSYCTRCNKVIVPRETTPKIDHTPVTAPAVAATCKSTGLTEGSKCSYCGLVFKEQQTLPKTDHKPVTDPAVAATCASVGKTEGSHCSVCGVIIKAQQTISKTSHTPVTDYAVAATCSSTGLTEGSHCSVCGTVLKAQETTPKAAHTPVTDPAVPATCTSEGLSEGSHCGVCGVTIQEQTVVEPAKGHDIRQSGYCNRCGQPQWSMSLSISPNYSSVGEDGSLVVTISYQLYGLDPNYEGSFTYRQTQTGHSQQSGTLGCTRNGQSGSVTVRLYDWEGTTLTFSVYSSFGWEIASTSYSF